MTPRFTALFLAGCAALCAGVGLGAGALAALVAGPLALALAFLARQVRAGVDEKTPRRLVAAGFALSVYGLLVAIAAPVGGIALVVAGLGACVCGSQLSLDSDAHPGQLAVPSTADLALNLAVAVDELAKFYWERRHFGFRAGRFEELAAVLRAAADRNEERGWLGHPERSHAPPPPLEKASLVTEVVRGVGAFDHLSFTSEYEPQDPEVRAAYLEQRANRTAHVYLLRRRGEPRPTLLVVHGFSMGNVAFDARFFEARWLADAVGLDVALAVLPLHGPRAEGASGQGFLGGHPLFTNAAMGQAIWDLRRLAGWLRGQGAPALGIMGYSMGGYTAALLASLDEGLACAVALMPASAPAELEWRLMPEAQQLEARAAGLTPQLIDNAWARHSPLRLRPRVPHEARLVIGGLADRIVPPAQVAALWEHWGEPAHAWLPGAHIFWRDRATWRTTLAPHLRRTLGGAVLEK